VFVDGEAQADGHITLVNDGKEHVVKVMLAVGRRVLEKMDN